MKRQKFIVISIALLGVCFFAFNNCGNAVRMVKGQNFKVSDTISGNPIVSFQALGYASAISNFRICVEQYELFSGESSFLVPGDTTEKDLSSQTATSLFNGPVPRGNYTALGLRLANNCGTGSSLAYSNSSGSVTVESEVTLIFEGEFSIVEEAMVPSIGLDFEPITDAFETATSEPAALEVVQEVFGEVVR